MSSGGAGVSNDPTGLTQGAGHLVHETLAPVFADRRVEALHKEIGDPLREHLSQPSVSSP